jgi:hypothetical protein
MQIIFLYFLAVVVLFLLFFFFLNISSRDSLEKRFHILAVALNEIVFGGEGYIEVVSKLEFFIRKKDSSQFVRFKYRLGYVYISLNLRIRGEWVIIKRSFLNKAEITAYDQLILEKDISLGISKVRKKVVPNSVVAEFDLDPLMH